MSNILSATIAMMCLGTSGNYNPACHKALEAGAVQSGYEAQFSNVENKTVAVGKDKAEKVLGNQKWFLGVALYTAKTVKEKKADFNVPSLGICDSINGEVAQKSYGMTLKWKF